MDKKDETMDQFGGQTLPGTGGDYIDESDVEGHRAKAQKAVDDGAGPEGQKRMQSFSGDESDVEGHRAKAQKAVDDGAGPEGQKRMQSFSGDESDVEGHRAPRRRRRSTTARAPRARSACSRSRATRATSRATGARRDAEPDGLYRGGPTTQGEVIRRGPGDNPHGDR